MTDRVLRHMRKQRDSIGRGKAIVTTRCGRTDVPEPELTSWNNELGCADCRTAIEAKAW